MKNTVTKTATFYFLSDGIIHCQLHDNIEIDVSEMKENHVALNKLANHKRCLILVNAESNSNLTKEAREYSVNSDVLKNFTACAIVAKNLAARIMWNHIAKKHSDILPTKTFFETEEAIDWLEVFLNTKNQSFSNSLNTFSIGQKIRVEFYKSGMSISEFSLKINTTRENVYNIFGRKSMDCKLLQKISQVLNYNFFNYYSKKIPVNITNNEIELLKKDAAILEKIILNYSSEIKYS